MLKLPKLIVEAVDLDLIWHVYSRGDVLVIVEGQVVDSYDEFVELCSKEPYRDRESIRMQLVHVASGG